ncbi:MAG: Flp family type IVb pilin [Propionibacteriales bacterium]|nr:Flp family type IVb pilin [Propionibacteriales bacterium]
MLEFMRKITSRRDEDGASAVEYGLLVAGIAALIVAIVFVFGGVIKDVFSKTCGKVSSGTAGSYSSTASCG